MPPVPAHVYAELACTGLVLSVFPPRRPVFDTVFHFVYSQPIIHAASGAAGTQGGDAVQRQT